MLNNITAVVAAISLCIGFYLGYSVGENKYLQLLEQSNKSYLKELERRDLINDELKELADDYYKKYKDASNKPPVTIPERVYVKAKCDTSTDVSHSDDRALDGGSTGDRAELHPETVRGVTEVTNNAETDVLKCQAVVESLIKQVRLIEARGQK